MKVSKFNYRPDIDGLRAIAVILVLGFHAFPSQIPGGFIGVDVFFVISGYLITSIILKENSADNWSYLAFYKRRTLRLFPALITLFTCCYVLGWNSLFANEFKILGKHLISSAGFFSNYTYWLESGYFDTASDRKILLHLWSLSVEEQFYLIWPICLLAFMRFNKTQIGILTILWASFAANCIWIFIDKELLYFSGFSRFWELVAGGYLAYRQNLSKPIISSKFHLHLSHAPLIAIGIILFCSLEFSSDIAFPGLWGVLPVVSVLGLLAQPAGLSLVHQVLSSRPLVYIGLISYPLYLWHWPLLSYLSYLDSESSTYSHRLLALVAAFILAIITYELVEKPIKQIHFRLQGIASITMIFIMALFAYIGYNTYSRDGLPFREAHSVRHLTSNQVQKTPDCLAYFSGFDLTFCRNRGPIQDSGIILYGDSHAHQYFSALSDRFSGAGIGLINVGWAGHPPIIENNKSRPHQTKVPSLIDYVLAQVKFHTVILSMVQPEELTPAAEKGLVDVIEKFQQAGKKVIYIQDNPRLPFHPIDCVGMPPLRQMKNPSCRVDLTSFPANFFTVRERIASLLKEKKVVIYDYLNILCPQGHCAIRENDLLLYETDGYISQAAAPILLRGFPLVGLDSTK